MGAPNGKVTWFEITTNDMSTARAFRALELGATTVVPPTDNPGGVRSAYLRDPDGSLLSIYRFGPPAVAVS